MKHFATIICCLFSLVALSACEEGGGAFDDFEVIGNHSASSLKIRNASYNPDKDHLIQEEAYPGYLMIRINMDGGSFMVVDKNGDLVSGGISEKEIELDPGLYYVISRDVDSFSAKPIVVEIMSDEDTEIEIMYEEDLDSEKGTLLIDFTPPFGAYYVLDSKGELVAVGFDSDEFRLKPGVYTVYPQKIQGLTTPKPKTVRIDADGVHRVKMIYRSLDITPDTGTVIARL